MIQPLGSPSALSLAAEPRQSASFFTVGSRGILISVAAAVFIYKIYTHHKEEKYREKIKAVNDLHKKYLERIIVPDHNEIRGFPPIYKMESDRIDSMHLTDSEVKAIGTVIPHGTEVVLSSYREAVQNAMLKLKDYYFIRTDKKDVTAGVLTYLLYMLESKCWNFAGYDYDIAYLDALANFVNDYASITGVRSQHFSRFEPIHEYLIAAKEALEKHKESLSLEALITDIHDSSIENSNSLLRLFVKFTVKSEDIPFVNTATMDELKDGLLRREYIHSQVKGKLVRKDHEIPLPESIFKQWIIALANYYLLVLSSGNIKDDTLFSLPNGMVTFADKARRLLFGKMKGTHLNERHKIKKELSLIHGVFTHNANLITTTVDDKNSENKFITVFHKHDLIDRTALLANIGKLIHLFISLQFISSNLLKNIQQLGEIYSLEPLHFNELFSVLDELCAFISETIQEDNEALLEIQRANAKVMRHEPEALSSQEILRLLESIKTSIKKFGDAIKEYKNKSFDRTKLPTVGSVNHDMCAIAKLISAIYPERFLVLPIIPPVIELAETKAIEQPVLVPIIEVPEEKSNITLSILMNKIEQKLPLLTEGNFKSVSYQNVVNELKIIQNKSIALSKEKDTTPMRREKSEKILTLAILLCEKTLTFFELPQATRQAKATQFSKEIQSLLGDQKTSQLIDRHNNVISKFIYNNICSLGIFRTDTRKKLENLNESFKSMGKNIGA